VLFHHPLEEMIRQERERISMSWIEKTCRSPLRFLDRVGGLSALVHGAFRAALLERRHAAKATFQVTVEQTYYTGWQAMPLVSLVAAVTGSLVAFSTVNDVNPLGSAGVGSTLFYSLVFRELSPLICGFIIIARSGTAIASELGNMRANGEVDALQSMAIDPLGFIVFPRLMAGMVSALALAVYFNLIAMTAAFVTANVVGNVALVPYVMALIQKVRAEDLLIVFLKLSAIGGSIFSIAAFEGLSVRKSHHEVPKAIIKAVVLSMVCVVVFSFFLTVISVFAVHSGGAV
jgi:phospholipid/cholesterol/gamma-HCH transport system permease protein